MEKKNSKYVITDMKRRISDISIEISWREIARQYFGKSSSWLYHKLDGVDGNGGEGGFTAEEAAKLKDSLYDLADRIKKCADSIEERGVRDR